jgi:hypothetical protein
MVLQVLVRKYGATVPVSWDVLAKLSGLVSHCTGFVSWIGNSAAGPGGKTRNKSLEYQRLRWSDVQALALCISSRPYPRELWERAGLVADVASQWWKEQKNLGTRIW